MKNNENIENSIEYRNVQPNWTVWIFVAFGILATINLLAATTNLFKPFEPLVDFVVNASDELIVRTAPNRDELAFGSLTEVQIIDAYDRCIVTDPNLTASAENQPWEDEPLKEEVPLYEYVNGGGGRGTFATAGENIGGVNVGDVINGGGNQAVLDAAVDMGNSYSIGIITGPGGQQGAVDFINASSASGLLPIIRLCFPDSCDFDMQNDPSSVANFYINVANAVGDTQFIAIVGPNEPGTANEMEAFGYPSGGYPDLVEDVNAAASQIKNAGVANALLSPPALNLTNSQNNDAAQILPNIDVSLFDIITFNAYDLDGATAFDFYGGTVFDLRGFAEQNQIPTVMTEFGTFTGNYDQLRQSANQLCADPWFAGILGFRSYADLPESIQPPPTSDFKYTNQQWREEILANCGGKELFDGTSTINSFETPVDIYTDWAWQNCNYDACIYQDEFDDKSVASACGDYAPRTNTEELISAHRVVCDLPPDPNTPDCRANRQITAQVSMPIRQFASNSPTGEDFYGYPSICAELASAFETNLPVQDPLNQFAGVLRPAGSRTFSTSNTPNSTSDPSSLGDLGDEIISDSIAIVGDSQTRPEPARGEFLPPSNFPNQDIRLSRPGTAALGVSEEGLVADVKATNPDHAVIMFGTNDCARAGYSPSEFREDLGIIADGFNNVIFISIPIIRVPNDWGVNCSEGVIGEFNQAMQELANEIGASYIDLENIYGSPDEYLYTDGLHITNYGVLNAAIAAVINGQSLPNLTAGGNSNLNSQIYPMPLLGSAINCSAELIKATPELNNEFDARTFSPNPGSTIINSYEDYYYDFLNGFAVPGTPGIRTSNLLNDEQIEEIQSRGRNVNDIDRFMSQERTVCGINNPGDNPENCVEISGNQELLSGLRPYSPVTARTSSYRPYAEVTSCSDELLIKQEPYNYIIGPEILVGEEQRVYEEYSDTLCRQWAQRKTDALQEGLYFTEGDKHDCAVRPLPPGSDETYSTGILAGAQVEAKNVTTCELLRGFCTEQEILGGTCKTDGLPVGQGPIDPNAEVLEIVGGNYSGCFSIGESGDIGEVYSTTKENINLEEHDIPEFEIPGINDSLFLMERRLQNLLSNRNLKVKFFDNYGWEVRTKLKARDTLRPYNGSAPEYTQESYNTVASCNAPAFFENDSYLAKLDSEMERIQYFEWLGVLDIIQELSVIYATDDFNSKEIVYENPAIRPGNEGFIDEEAINSARAELATFEFNELPETLQKDKLLGSGNSSLSLRFPIPTCDDLEIAKFIAENNDDPSDNYLIGEYRTCLTFRNDTSYDNLSDAPETLEDYLCEQGYTVGTTCNQAAVCVAPDAPTDLTLFPVGANDPIPSCVEPNDASLSTPSPRIVNTDRPFFGGTNDPNQTEQTFTLRADTADDLERMMADMQAEDPEAYSTCGFNWGYRSAALQRSFVENGGSCGSGTGTACACESEHQLGTTVDFRPADPNQGNQLSFENTSCFDWINENAAEYGFVRSYFPGNPDGYSSEPWHWRWIGPAEAQNFQNIQDEFGGHLKNYLEDRWAELNPNIGNIAAENSDMNMNMDMMQQVDPANLNLDGFNPIFPTSNTNPFGAGLYGDVRAGFIHSGVDFPIRAGSPIVAVEDGEVIFAGLDTFNPSGAYGFMVRIRHDNGFISLYAHMLTNPRSFVSVGDRVSQGQQIGEVGSTGNSTGPHLHLEFRAFCDRWDGGEAPFSFNFPGIGVIDRKSCTVDPVPFMNGVAESPFVIEQGGIIDPDLIQCIHQDGMNIDPSDFIPGQLACEIDLNDTSDRMNWQAAERMIEARYERYNDDTNASYMWATNLEIPYRGARRDAIVQLLGGEAAFEADRAQRVEMTEYVIQKAVNYNLNPRFVYTLWIEESGGSAIGGAALGCFGFRRTPYEANPARYPNLNPSNPNLQGSLPQGDNFDAMLRHMDEQIECLATYIVEFPEFSQFMCTYSGEPGSPNCDTNNFTNNPNFPASICSLYNYQVL